MERDNMLLPHVSQHFSYLLGACLLVVVACQDTWKEFHEANPTLTNYTKQEGESTEWSCAKSTESMNGNEFNAFYRWVHFPLPDRDATGTNTSNLSGHSSCDFSQINRLPAVSIPYDLPPTSEDQSALRILVFGRNYMNTNRDPNVLALWFKSGNLTSTGFPGSFLRNRMILPEDEGLWMCCTSQNRQALRKILLKVKPQPPKTETQDLPHPPGYAVLSSDDCAKQDPVINKNVCDEGDCNCRVMCSLSCEHNTQDYFYTWTFTDRVLNLTHQRIVAVDTNFWRTQSDEIVFTPDGAHLTIVMREKYKSRKEPREYFGGWMKFRKGQITIQCNIVEMATGWKSSASLDIDRLQELRPTEPQLNASSCILEPPAAVDTRTTAALSTLSSATRDGDDVTPALIATRSNVSSSLVTTSRSPDTSTGTSDRPSNVTPPADRISIANASTSIAGSSVVSRAAEYGSETPTDNTVGALVTGGTVGGIVAMGMAAAFVCLCVKWKRAIREKERNQGRTAKSVNKGGKHGGQFSLGANSSNSSQLDIMGEQGYAYVSQSSHGSANSSLASPSQQLPPNTRCLDLRYSRPPQGKSLGHGGWPSDADAPPGVPPGYGACFAHPFSTAVAQATLQSWNANRTHLTPFRFLAASDLAHWSIQREKISLGTRIGKGAFGQVYLGTYHGSPTCIQEIALKMPKDGMFDSQECLQDMISEANIMFRVCQGKSPHLVNLVGVCVDDRGPPIIVLEHCGKGSLIGWLRAWRKAYGSATAASRVLPDLTAAAQTQRRKQSAAADADDDAGDDANEAPYVNRVSRDVIKPTVSRSNAKRPGDPLAEATDAGYANTAQEPRTKSLASLMISFAHQISSGMEALVRYNVVHRDLAARNILLTHDSTVKIADFGLARDISAHNGYYRMQNHATLPYLWMAPETLPAGENENIVFTEKTDVWSFGVVLWEIATLGKVPYGRGTPLAHLHSLLTSGERLPDPGCCDEVRKMMSACWHDDPKERPTFSQLRHYFASKLEKRADCQYLRLLDDTSVGTVDIIQESSNEESDFV